MKRFSLFSLAGIVLSGLIFLPPAFSQTNETLTISTYYPSPYGVYNELRLYPKAALPPGNCSSDINEGTMYYDNTANQLMVCRETGFGIYTWQSASSLWTINGTNLYPNNTTWNVGIGTTGPGYALSVAGVIHGQATANSGDVLRIGNDIKLVDIDVANTAGLYGLQNTTIASLQLGSSGGIISGYNGNVGIGTTSPTQALDVTGGANAAVAIFENTGPNPGGGGELLLQHRNNAGARVTYASVKAYTTDGSTGTEGGALVFKTRNVGTLAEKARIDRNGNVGIGTTGPNAKLELWNSYSSGVDSLRFGYNDGNAYWMGIQPYVVAGGNVGYKFRTNNIAATVDAMAITGSGNVGIGTTWPWAKLDIAGSDVVGIRYIKSGSKDSRIQLGDPTRVWALAVGWATAGDFSIIEEGVAGDRLYIKQGGNVGIGTTNPGVYKLNIAGTGYLNAAAWVYGSDIRLKENISYIQSGLEVIEQLKPVKFDYIKGDKKQTGFIAQEAREVLPDIVTEGPDGMLGMKTESIIPYLVKAMQEQQKEIEALKAKLNVEK
jgi:hypothetical protein